MATKVLLVGFGSAGKRLGLAALQLGKVEVVSWDPLTSPESLSERLQSESYLSHACICSPPEHHFEQASLCLDYGLHVLVEKPLALSEVDARLLVEKSQERGKNLVVGSQLRFLSTMQKVYDDLIPYRQDAWIGHCHFGYDIRHWHPKETPYTPRIGVQYEVGTHELDFLCWLFGTLPSSVQSTAIIRHPAFGEAPCSLDTTLFIGNSVISVHLDYVSPIYRRYLFLAGESRYIHWFLDPVKDHLQLFQASQAMMKEFLFGGTPLTSHLATGAEGLGILGLIAQLTDKDG